jgi:hypothetical protein
MSIEHDLRPNAARPFAEKNSAEPSVLKHDPEEWDPRTISQSAVTIHPEVIALQHRAEAWLSDHVRRRC